MIFLEFFSIIRKSRNRNTVL